MQRTACVSLFAFSNGEPVSTSPENALDIFEALGREPVAHAIDVETELTGHKPLARFGLLGLTNTRRLGDGLRPIARHDTDAVVVSHDHVAGADRRAGADDRHVHRAERLLDGALRGDRLRPDGELHLGEVANVAHAGLDDQASHAVRPERSRQQLAEIAVIAWA